MKQWIVPLLCALGVHAALFNFDPASTRPVLAVRPNRSVTISLVQRPAAVRAKPVRPLALKPPAAIAPLARLAPLPPAPVTPRPEPAEKKVSAPLQTAAEPVAPEETPTAPADAGTTPGQDAPDAIQAPHGPDQARVQASVPLYDLNPPPHYPAVARRRNYQGTVVLDVLVDRTGRAARVRVAESCGHGLLDRSAVESVRQWRFEPARRMGQAVEMWVRVPVTFRLR